MKLSLKGLNKGRVLLLVSALAVTLLYVTINQNLTIASQRAELVKQLQTLIASQQAQGKMIHQMDAQEKQFEHDLQSCKK